MPKRPILRLALGAALALLIGVALWGAYVVAWMIGFGAGMPDGAQGPGPSPAFLAAQAATEAACLGATRALPGVGEATVEVTYSLSAVEAYRVALWAPSTRPGADPDDDGRLVICFARDDGAVLSLQVHGYGAP